MSHKTSKLIRRAFKTCPLLIAMYGRLSDSQYKAVMRDDKKIMVNILAPDKRRVYQYAKSLTIIAIFLLLTPFSVSTGHIAKAQSPVDALIPRIIEVESNGNPKVISKKGAIGLMQIMPFWVPTLKKHGIIKKSKNELLDPETNVKAGKFILAHYYSGGHKGYYGRVMKEVHRGRPVGGNYTGSNVRNVLGSMEVVEVVKNGKK